MSELPSEIASLLIPIEGNNLLVPNTCVAEIVSFSSLESGGETSNILLGTINWRDLNIPCVAYEGFNTDLNTSELPINRIAILNTVSNESTLQFYALAIRGIPRLIRVTDEDIVSEEVEEFDGEESLEAIHQVVKVNGESAFIPDLEKLELAIQS